MLTIVLLWVNSIEDFPRITSPKQQTGRSTSNGQVIHQRRGGCIAEGVETIANLNGDRIQQ